MNNQEIIEILKRVKNDVKNKKYDRAIKFLDKKIIELTANENSASSYIDDLVSSLM